MPSEVRKRRAHSSLFEAARRMPSTILVSPTVIGPSTTAAIKQAAASLVHAVPVRDAAARTRRMTRLLERLTVVVKTTDK